MITKVMNHAVWVDIRLNDIKSSYAIRVEVPSKNFVGGETTKRKKKEERRKEKQNELINKKRKYKINRPNGFTK